jgi:adenine deaminase
MLLPSEFARLAVVHGTVGTVSDPHEIANVLGMKGIQFMIKNGKSTPFGFYFGAPSCVPATPFETSGAKLGIKETETLLDNPEIKYLSEMMNFPGVLYDDTEVNGKLSAAKVREKVIDGHAPGITGKDIIKYAAAGVSTDHECFTLEEAREKIQQGIKILIREGSAAKNFDELLPLLAQYPQMVMFCSDDKHPDDLVKGHINQLVKRAIDKGYNIIDCIRACTLNPVRHYGLDSGLLQAGDNADCIIVDNLNDFTILSTFINGEKVAEGGRTLLSSVQNTPLNNFNAKEITISDLQVVAKGKTIRVIKALEGQLITDEIRCKAKIENGYVVSDTENDILKIVAINRYQPSAPAIGFINNFKLQKGAFASTVAHDSHNIIAIGTSDKELLHAIKLIISSKGGICCVQDGEEAFLSLPFAGLMSTEDGYKVAENYEKINEKLKAMGCQLNSPFMTLSFMALLVIPNLKISDKGLFDSKKFAFTSLFV